MTIGIARHFGVRMAALLTSVTLAISLPGIDSAQAEDAEWQFEIQFSKEAYSEPYTGRVYVFTTRGPREPRFGPNWFRPETFLSKDVTDLKPGQTVELTSSDPDVLVYPESARKKNLAGSSAQAVIRFNPWERQVGTGAGNGHSSVVKLGDSTSKVSFTVDQLVKPQEFTDSKWSKLHRVDSKLLTDFHKHSTALQAAVMLPASYYDKPDRRYPVIYSIPGFGGRHFGGQRDEPIKESNDGEVEFIRVLLDPSCGLGHHVFANSANNGPVGDALVNEFIPSLDRAFRTVPKSTARFVTGHSSGGWSSLWLQVVYRKTFGGTWSTSPDPVCFDDFQRINLYRNKENMYVDSDGNRRPLARANGRVMIWYDDFSRMERVLGPGGQLHSFEAVFSQRGDDGRPVLVWDRQDGTVDTEAAKAWKKYDIRKLLVDNWDDWKGDLAGKIRVHMGDVDTFYLEGASILLKESLEEMEADALVEIHKGKDHSDILTSALRDRMRREMSQQFLKYHADEIE